MKKRWMYALPMLVPSLFLLTQGALKYSQAQKSKRELTLYHTGVGLVREEQYRSAIPYFMPIVTNQPQFLLGHYYLGICFLKTGIMSRQRSN